MIFKMVDSIQSTNLVDLIYDLEQKFMEKYGLATIILTNWDTDVFSNIPLIKEDIIDSRRVYIITDGINKIEGIYLWN